ncbi:MAG TPA: DUF2891 domain-containing protein [Ktedonobacterales bacterium]|nr:DUF2891 domain-containing protein [Ktedonobacterales bacterium]
MGLIAEWGTTLRANAADYACVALSNVAQEFPSDVHHVMQAPDDFPRRPRQRTPVFYGSFDWHSCVEMYWLLARLLRCAGDCVPQQEIRAALDERFTAEGLAAEAHFIGLPMNGTRERPYGWGWALRLVHELQTWDDPDAQRWAARFVPLAETLTSSFLTWLPKATYPVRYGIHSNSAFGLSQSLPYARERAQAGDGALLEAMISAARRWYAADADYPGDWEPSGQDFLSPALVEAELMAQVLPAEHFARWLEAFLPGIAEGRPEALFTPAVVSDASDPYIAHLHGLNASRAWCWRRIAESLPHGDSRIERTMEAAATHAQTALPYVAGEDYMVEHWLACYAVLMLS